MSDRRSTGVPSRSVFRCAELVAGEATHDDVLAGLLRGLAHQVGDRLARVLNRFLLEERQFALVQRLSFDFIHGAWIREGDMLGNDVRELPKFGRISYEVRLAVDLEQHADSAVVVYVCLNGRIGVLLEINCET